jgi:uncharacterized membrane protein YgdD (TMEM256/DUF423 family)
MKANQWAGIAAISLAIATIIGALGAHALEDILTPDQLQSFETGVRYHVYQSLGLFAIAVQQQFRVQKWTMHLLFWGMILFSASIYLLNLDEYIGLSLSFLGPITPIGGLLIIAAWTSLGVTLFTQQKSS